MPAKYVWPQKDSDELVRLWQSGEYAEGTLAKKYNKDPETIRKELTRRGQDTSKEARFSRRAEAIKEGSRKTNLSRYGVEWHQQSEEGQRVRKQTLIDKYGSIEESYRLRQEKTRRTCRKRYGAEHNWSHDSSSRRQLEERNQERWGVKSFFGTEEFRQLQRESYEEWYRPSRQYVEFRRDPEAFLDGLDTPLSTQEIAERLSLSESSVTLVYELLKPYRGHSKYRFTPRLSHYEEQLAEYFRELGVPVETQSPVYGDRCTCDLFFPEKKLVVEFNGSYWHSEEFKSQQFHLGRSERGREQGYHVYHIFEYLWHNHKDAYLSQLRSLLGLDDERIYARKCEVRGVEPSEAREFLEAYHVQGFVGSTHRLGLYHDGELVSLMTFSHPRTQRGLNKMYTWELKRFCTKSGVRVVGGASKLFTSFVRAYTHQGDVIVSWSDKARNKWAGEGSVYERLGFVLKSVNDPGYVWFNPRTEKVKSRYQTQFKNERTRMQEEGYRRIFDCGTETWTFTV